MKCKELRRHEGITRLLSASEMQERWETETYSAPEETPAVSERGYVYEDYLEGVREEDDD